MPEPKDSNLREIFEKHVPEYRDQRVEIKRLARQPGVRALVAVGARDGGLDALTTFIGPKACRAKAMSADMGGETLTVVTWDERLEHFIVNTIITVAPTSENFSTPRVKLDESQGSAIVELEPTFFQAFAAMPSSLLALANEFVGVKMELVRQDRP